MKKFFTSITLQDPEKVREAYKYCYKAVGNRKLDMKRKTAFPILTAVNGYLKQNEPYQVIAITEDSDKGRANLENFKNELRSICDERHFLYVEPQAVFVGKSQEVSAHCETFLRLVSCVADDDELFACITFGTKPQSVIVRMAVQYAYRVKSNTSIQCILYGQIDRPSSDPSTYQAYVYDETALVQMDEMVRLLVERGVTDPTDVLRELLGMQEGKAE